MGCVFVLVCLSVCLCMSLWQPWLSAHESEEQRSRRRQMGLRGVEDIKCAMSICECVHTPSCVCVRVSTDDLCCSGWSSTVCMTQIAGFMLCTRLQMVTGEASVSLHFPSTMLFLNLLPATLTLTSSSPSVHICFGLPYSLTLIK